MAATASDAEGINIELDKMLVTTMLSIILYGRQAFPENCFRELSVHDIEHPQPTHKHLLKSGQPLSSRDNPFQTLSSDRQTLVYLRECSNPRLHSLLANLDQIFAALADRLVGKIYICFNDTKKWSKNSLLECYTLKFGYTEAGALHAHAHWAGKGDMPLNQKLPGDFFKALKQVVLSCPQLPGQFYTRLFVSAVDKQTELQGVWGGDGHGIRDILLNFRDKSETSSLRIGMFTCSCEPQEADQEAESTLDRLLPEVSPPAATPDLPDLPDLHSSPTIGSNSSDLDLAASPAGPSNPNEARPQRSSTTRSSRQRSVDTSSQPNTGLYHEIIHNSMFSADGHGRDSGGQAEGHPAHGNRKKRPASQDQFVPVTQTSKARTTVVAKHPRLAMIEEVPEDLSPTQRLKTPSQSRQALDSTLANPDLLTDDSEASPSPLARRRTSAVLGNTWEAPRETWQAASPSRSPQKANTARTYGGRSRPGGKRAFTMA